MADAIDHGCEREALDRELALKVRRPDGPPATGQCLFCEEPLDEGVRWCDAQCRDFWQATQGGS